MWWRQTDQVPYPTPVQGKNQSDSVTASLTHVFSPSMTNEFVFGYTFIGFPERVRGSVEGGPHEGRLQLHRACTRTAFRRFRRSAATAGERRKPRWSSIRADSKRAAPSAGLYANKYMPSFSDTVTKVWGTHTVKAGFFWEWIRNAQPANNNTNGYLQVERRQLQHATATSMPTW